MLQITKAVKEKIDLRAAITGPTGGGKTYTALRMAFAVIGNQSGKVLVIDTERKSARKYADEKPDGATWNFDVLELPDFSPSTYTEAIKLGIQSEYDVIIVDSLSHAWEGEGGILELQQKYGGRYQDWAKVNPLHFGLIDTILNAPCHMIVTMRSKMDYAIETVEDAKGNKKTQVTKVGMAPIQRNGVQYEFDFILDMDNANVGRVDKTRCSAMRGKTAAMPGPGFFRPLIDWLNSGEMPVKEIAPETPVIVEQPTTNGQAAQPESKPAKPTKKPQWSTASQAFYDHIQQVTDGYFENEWQFLEVMKKLGLDWSFLNALEAKEAAESALSDYARMRRAEKESA